MYTFLFTSSLFIIEKVFTKIHLINLMKLASAMSFVAPYEQRTFQKVKSIHMAVIPQIPLASSIFCTWHYALNNTEIPNYKHLLTCSRTSHMKRRDICIMKREGYIMHKNTIFEEAEWLTYNFIVNWTGTHQRISSKTQSELNWTH
jgi:hypothetical protein